MNNYLCIDPGASGGWVLNLEPAITTGDIEELTELYPPLNTTVVIEKVPAFVGRAIPSSASFSWDTLSAGLSACGRGADSRWCW